MRARYALRGALVLPALASLVLLYLLNAPALLGQSEEPSLTQLDEPPDGVAERPSARVDAIGTHGAWQFVYRGGFESDDLLLPEGVPIFVRLRTAQTGYRFSVPDFGIDVPVAPGGPTELWLLARGVGDFALSCGECGELGPSRDAHVALLASPDFRARVDTWGGTRYLSQGQRGELLFNRFACGDCHRLGGRSGVAGSPMGLWGGQLLLEDGTMVDVHGESGRAFLAESIREPDAAYTAGFMSGAMPALAANMSDAEIDALVQFVRCMGADPCADPECAGLRGCAPRMGN